MHGQRLASVIREVGNKHWAVNIFHSVPPSSMYQIYASCGHSFLRPEKREWSPIWELISHDTSHFYIQYEATLPTICVSKTGVMLCCRKKNAGSRGSSTWENFVCQLFYLVKEMVQTTSNSRNEFYNS